MPKKSDYVLAISDDCFRFVDVSAADAEGKQSFIVHVDSTLTLRANSFRLKGTVNIADSKADPNALKGQAHSNFEVYSLLRRIIDHDLSGH